MTTTQRHQSAVEGDGYDDDGGLGEYRKPLTVPEPFNITKPRPKVILQPEALERQLKANPVPSGMFKKSLPEIEKEKTERRKINTESIRQEYEENTKKRFMLATEARPNASKYEEKK
jgi:hypothetical protein